MKKFFFASVPVICTVVLLVSCQQQKEEAKTGEQPAQKVESQQVEVKKEEKQPQIVEKQKTEITEEKEEVSVQKETETSVSGIDGEMVFKSHNCQACHHPEVDTTGPSLKKIAEFYRGKKDRLISFFRGEADPIVDPARFTIMKPQINITKKLSDEELSALADFILKH